MAQRKCESSKFRAYQTCHNIIVDGNNKYLEGNVPIKRPSPFGPYESVDREIEFDELLQ